MKKNSKPIKWVISSKMIAYKEFLCVKGFSKLDYGLFYSVEWIIALQICHKLFK